MIPSLADPRLRRIPGAPLVVTLLLLGAAALAAPDDAHAQSGAARVRALTREATEAYTNLDIERAESLLARAVAEARRRRVGGRPLAEVHVVRGVVAVAGHGDLEGGAEAFAAAIEADRTVEVDRMLSNPQIDSVFREAQARAGITPSGGHPLSHTPPTEQLERTPIPVYVELPEGVQAHQLIVRFWPEGQDETYDEAALEPVGDGYGVELPCVRAGIGGMQYYVVAIDDAGQVTAQAGSEDEPYTVPFVAERTVDEPALPTRRPPDRCDEACVPGSSCDEEVEEGGACQSSSDCASGLACEDDVCVAPDAATSEGGIGRRFFVRAGYAAGSGYARQGGHADTGVPFHPSTRPQDFVGEWAPAGYTEAAWIAFLQSVGNPYSGYTENLRNDYTGGPLAGDFKCQEEQGEFCVRLQTEGLVFVHGGEVQAGFLVTPRFAIVGGLRVAASAGEGPLSRFLVTGGFEVRIVEPVRTGLLLTVQTGLGLGQIQLRPSQGGGGILEPFIRTGLGNMNLSVIGGYRFLEGVGVYIKPTMHGFFPDRTFVAEGSAGVEFLF